MKLLLPILTDLNIQSGFGIRNPLKIRSLKAEPEILIQLWKDFELLDSKNIKFDGLEAVRIFLNEIFPAQTVATAKLATVEFDPKTFSIDDQKEFFKESFEGQCIFQDQASKNWTALLYDFIPDKKSGHRYSPILHCAHSAYVSDLHDSYAVLANFRPPYLKAETITQNMNMQIKSPQGELLSEKKMQLPFNASSLISIKDEFSAVGGFKPGSTLNFKGGASQFAIFTLFRNKKTGSLGIEHSLAPIYYCSGVLNPETRKTFYQNAFSDIKDMN